MLYKLFILCIARIILYSFNDFFLKHVANISEKRNSGLHLSISSKMTTPIDNSLLSESSVPPSPYKQENYFELPAVSSAIRKISFEQSPVSTMCLKNPMSPDQVFNFNVI